MTIKSTKLAALVAAALSLAAPLAVSPADAAPFHNTAMVMKDHDGERTNFVRVDMDARHAPAPRHEMRPPMPHRGFHWHLGQYRFARGHWVWVPGFWNIR